MKILPCAFHSNSHMSKAFCRISSYISSAVPGCRFDLTSTTLQCKVLCKAKQITMVHTHTNHSSMVCREKIFNIMLQLQGKILHGKKYKQLLIFQQPGSCWWLNIDLGCCGVQIDHRDRKLSNKKLNNL